uniref:Uncharacterized protein n=1 Tax=Ditylenchus dipsaci TaxID=166011 RepID=A0A915CM36_9BILA
MWQFLTNLFSDPQQPAPVVQDEKIDEVEEEQMPPEEAEEDLEAAVANSFPVSCLTADGNTCLGIGQAIDGEDDEGEPSFPGDFTLGNIKEATFLKVVEWCKEHVGKPDPVVREDPQTFERIHFVYTPFESKFLDVSVPELQELLLAASFLDIRSSISMHARKGLCS